MSKPNTKLLNSQKILALIGISVCCGLLLLAVPRFIASLYALYPEAAFKQMPQTLPTEVYEKSIADLNKALSWYQNPIYWQAQGFFYLQLFYTRPFQTPAQKQTYLKQAKAAITRGLSLSPVDPRGWLQLAVVDSLLKSPKQPIINALRLSFYAGRVEPELVISRLRFSYIYYADFTEDMQQLWQKQIPVAWVFKAQQLVKFIAAHPEAKQLALKAFIYSPEDADKFLSRFK
jgi:hypothetical protein